MLYLLIDARVGLLSQLSLKMSTSAMELESIVKDLHYIILKLTILVHKMYMTSEWHAGVEKIQQIMQIVGQLLLKYAQSRLLIQISLSLVEGVKQTQSTTHILFQAMTHVIGLISTNN